VKRTDFPHRFRGPNETVPYVFAIAALMGSFGRRLGPLRARVEDLFLLETAHASYVFGVNENGALQNIYWGGKVSRAADFPPAHTVPEHAPCT
jgi:hypothetical protein